MACQFLNSSYSPQPIPFLGIPDILPQPLGPFGVGVKYLTTKAINRTLNIQVYYPTTNKQLSVDPPYFTNFEAFKSNRPDLPANMTMPRILHWSTGNATIAAGTFSVILLSHGLGFPHEQYTSLCQEIASRGKAVVKISHAGFTQSEPFRQEMKDYLYMATHTDASLMNTENTLNTTASIAQIFTDDVATVLNYLPSINSQLNNSLQIDKPTLIGHSIGARADAKVLNSTSIPLSGVLNLDGAVDPINFVKLNSVPYKRLNSFQTFNNTAKMGHDALPTEFEQVVENSEHVDFATDGIVLQKCSVYDNIHQLVLQFLGAQ